MAMKYTKTVTIDMATDYSNTITAKQNDSARTVLITLVNKGEVFKLPSSSIKFYALKPDGTRVFNNVIAIDVNNGTVEVELTSQTLSAIGKVKCELAFYENEKILTTVCFDIKVQQGVRSDSAIESTDEFSALTDAITQVNTWNDYFDELSGEIETKYTTRLNQAESDINDLQTEVPTKLSLSGGTMTGNINLKNGIALSGIDKNGANVDLLSLYGQDAFVGSNNNNNLYLRSKKNPIVQVNDINYKIYHEGNKPTKADVGLGNVDNTADSIKSVAKARDLSIICQTLETGNANTNKYYKLATFKIFENYGCYNGEFNVGFCAHGMSNSPHHKLGVWIKRQDSTFAMDLKVWGANEDNYATYLLVKTGDYEATLYAFLRIQYCALYMTRLGSYEGSATVNFFSGASPENTVGLPNVYGKIMDSKTYNTTLFAGTLLGQNITNPSDISTVPIDTARINKNNCFTGDYFTVPSTGSYLFTGYCHINNSTISGNGVARLFIQEERIDSSYVSGIDAFKMNLEINKAKNYTFTKHMYLSEGNRIKFYHNVDEDGAKYSFSRIDLTIIKLG